jgi:lipopolysaccharide transport system ATP-binding protein
MYVRLAFAVAAHLNPDILVIDEVLAVGDTVFQKKCIEKISDINSQGRTVLFVSHNLSLINSLCKTGVLLQDGQVRFQGTARETVDNYVGEGSLDGEIIDLKTIERRSGKQDISFGEIKFMTYPVKFGCPLKFKIKLKADLKSNRYKEVDFGVAVSDRERTRVVHCSNRFIGFDIEYVSDSDEYVFEIQNILKPGEYYLTLFLRTQDVIQDWLTDALKFEVEDGNPYGYYDTSQINGMILPEFKIYKEE